MKKGLKKVQYKIQLSVIPVIIVIFAATLFILGNNSNKRIKELTVSLADTYAEAYAQKTQNKLNYYMDATRFVMQVFEDYESISEDQRRKVLSSVLRSVLAKNKDFLSVWSILKPGSIDNLDSSYINTVGSTILGNFRYIYYKEGGSIKLSEVIEQDPNAVLSGSIYTLVKKRAQETIIDPYYYSYTGNDVDNVLQTNMVAPLVVNGDFFGVVGTDIPLATLQKMYDDFKPFENSFSFLITNSGKIVTFPDKNTVGKAITSINFVNNNKVKLSENLANGEKFNFETYYKGSNFYVSLVPVKIGNTQTPWFVGFAIPKSVINQTAVRNFNYSLIVGIIGIIILVILIWLLSLNIARPIKTITEAIENIASGNVDNTLKLNIGGRDEITEMADAVNRYIDGYIDKTEFAQKIGEGKLDAQFKMLGENDLLGKSLIAMRDSLRLAKEDESNRLMEDQKRRWHNEGIAKFAEIMRQNHDSINKLSYTIISNLVEYLNANQGGMFVMNNDSRSEEYLELLAAYAYNKEKFLKKIVPKGVGLVGTCAIEKKTILLNKVPENYIALQSGLGEAIPKSLIIVPLKIEENVLGVIELASLKVFEPYQTEFIEKIAESIAATIASVRINIRTTELLEKSQQQAEEMSAQEEEMRQNMEELQATQEEASRRESELKNVLHIVDDFLIKAELSPEGFFIDINNHFSSVFGYSPTEIKEKSIDIIVPEDDMADFKNIWYRVQNGESFQGRTPRITKKGRILRLQTTYAPIRDINMNIVKILMLANKPD